MDIANFIIGQLVGLVEPFLAIDFIIKCLDWKEQVKHRKQLYRCLSGMVYSCTGKRKICRKLYDYCGI